MGKSTGFKEFKRKEDGYISVKKRVRNYNEFSVKLDDKELKNQGSRCMDCGIPFCHSSCPLGNLIPDFNHMVHQEEWQKASWILHSTNNFPEFTGRLCPAPCEKSCVLGIIEEPVSIENIEKNIVEKGFKNGWIKPKIPAKRTNYKIAIIGSGPAGLAAAQQLNSVGHNVIVYEKEDKIGGLLRYGIPNFKLEKKIIDRRVNILKKEGIKFITNANVGVNISISELEDFDSIVLCGGASEKRALNIPGAKSNGVIQAMDLLTNQTKSLYDESIKTAELKNKNVVVIGGGDTGSDCVGTANRNGAKSVINFEIMPKPPLNRSVKTPWPYWPLQLKNSTSHKEGCDRNWLINTKEFIFDKDNNLTGLKTVNVKWEIKKNNPPKLIEIVGSEKTWDCDIALLALGFTGAESSLADKLGVKISDRNNYQTTNYQTNIPKIFSAGDMRRGQSLIVWAISEGREAAREVDLFLTGKTSLATKGKGQLPMA